MEENITRDSKKSFFAVIKIVNSLALFFSSLTVFVIGMIAEFAIGAGALSLKDTDLDAGLPMVVIAIFSVIPLIISIVLLCITIIFAVKCFKGEYSQALDIVSAIIHLVIDAILMIICFFATLGAGFVYSWILGVFVGMMIWNVIESSKKQA